MSYGLFDLLFVAVNEVVKFPQWMVEGHRVPACHDEDEGVRQFSFFAN